MGRGDGHEFAAKVIAALSEPLMQLVGDMTIYNYVWKAGLDLGLVLGLQSVGLSLFATHVQISKTLRRKNAV